MLPAKASAGGNGWRLIPGEPKPDWPERAVGRSEQSDQAHILSGCIKLCGTKLALLRSVDISGQSPETLLPRHPGGGNLAAIRTDHEAA